MKPREFGPALPIIDCGRRTFLSVGGLALGGMALPGGTPAVALGEDNFRSDRAVIQIFMGGGPSHLDMYDMKPNAPAEIRGEFQEIDTNVPGIRICEHLTAQARVMDKVAIVRSVNHSNPSHLPASHWMMTGHEQSAAGTGNSHPSIGAVVAKMRGSNHSGLPPYVSIPRRQLLGAAAFLGPAYNPFTTESDPSKPDFTVKNLDLPQGMNIPRLQHRQELLASLDRLQEDMDRHNEFDGVERFSHAAMEMVTSERALKAFDLNRESPRVRAAYGMQGMGQACLLARRLVEAGVTFVTVLSGGEWDTHSKNFPIMKSNNLPRVDQPLAALVEDLYQRGLQDRVLIVAYGEFGRTPRINKEGGRDHWPGAASVLFSGGGIRVGQIIGATDPLGAFPVTRRYSPEDVLATMYHFLGINTDYAFTENTLRPTRILEIGRPIPELRS